MRKWLLVFVFVCFGVSVAKSQTPATTTVKDTVYRSDGSLASGTVVITWPAFNAADSKPVFGATKTVTLTSGALAVALVPNAGATPSGTSYNVKYYQSGAVFSEETWVVPSSSPLATPGVPTVSPVGTTGSTTYCYWISARNAVGETLLGPSTCITNGNATLDMTNYNSVSWTAVSGATSYRVWRKGNSTAPSGTGNFLVGTTTGTTLSDQSNNLTSATVPSINDTDPRTLGQVRVLGTPSPAVMVSPSQVSGTAVVQNPSATQVISAPASAGIIPLRVRGSSAANANVLELYDSAGTPALQSWFDSGGAFKTTKSVGINATSPQTTLDVGGAIRSTLTTVASSATPTFNAALGNSFKMTLTANVTGSTIANPQTGEFMTLLLCQDATGSRAMTWPANLKLAGGSFTLTTTANKCDSLTAVYDGSNWYETARSTNL